MHSLTTDWRLILNFFYFTQKSHQMSYLIISSPPPPFQHRKCDFLADSDSASKVGDLPPPPPLGFRQIWTSEVDPHCGD